MNRAFQRWLRYPGADGAMAGNRRRRRPGATDDRIDGRPVLSGSSLTLESLTSGRPFGYLARRPGNRAPPHGAPGEEPARDTCKWWTPEGGVAGNGGK